MRYDDVDDDPGGDEAPTSDRTQGIEKPGRPQQPFCPRTPSLIQLPVVLACETNIPPLAQALQFRMHVPAHETRLIVVEDGKIGKRRQMSILNCINESIACLVLDFAAVEVNVIQLAPSPALLQHLAELYNGDKTMVTDEANRCQLWQPCSCLVHACAALLGHGRIEHPVDTQMLECGRKGLSSQLSLLLPEGLRPQIDLPLHSLARSGGHATFLIQQICIDQGEPQGYDHLSSQPLVDVVVDVGFLRWSLLQIHCAALAILRIQEAIQNVFFVARLGRIGLLDAD
mmetsp:Transcript_25841/g.65175  ORF Transcript_25841/g.65175 Transcript_25841/m.65175 type:complete len:286 (+) Transcript_25841:200-1057(+)